MATKGVLHHLDQAKNTGGKKFRRNLVIPYDGNEKHTCNFKLCVPHLFTARVPCTEHDAWYVLPRHTVERKIAVGISILFVRCTIVREHYRSKLESRWRLSRGTIYFIIASFSLFRDAKTEDGWEGACEEIYIVFACRASPRRWKGKEGRL